MKTVRPKLDDAKQGTQLDGKACDKVPCVRGMGKNSTTSVTIVPEVWIMSGLLLSLVMQIVSVSHLPKLEDQPEDR